MSIASAELERKVLEWASSSPTIPPLRSAIRSAAKYPSPPPSPAAYDSQCTAASIRAQLWRTPLMPTTPTRLAGRACSSLSGFRGNLPPHRSGKALLYDRRCTGAQILGIVVQLPDLVLRCCAQQRQTLPVPLEERLVPHNKGKRHRGTDYESLPSSLSSNL